MQISAQFVVQTPNYNYPHSLSKNYLKSYYKIPFRIIKSPFSWNRKAWIKTLSCSILIAGTYYFADNDINRFALNNGNDNLLNISSKLSIISASRNLLAFSAGGYIFGKICKNARIKQATLLSIQSILISGGAAFLVKRISGRERPYSGKSYNKWRGLNTDDNLSSFYSAHSTTAFAFAAILNSLSRRKKITSPIYYGLATTVALSRVYEQKHWTSDVVTAAIVGIFFSKVIINTQFEESKISMSPLFGKDLRGVKLCFSFN